MTFIMVFIPGMQGVFSIRKNLCDTPHSQIETRLLFKNIYILERKLGREGRKQGGEEEERENRVKKKRL